MSPVISATAMRCDPVREKGKDDVIMSMIAPSPVVARPASLRMSRRTKAMAS